MPCLYIYIYICARVNVFIYIYINTNINKYIISISTFRCLTNILSVDITFTTNVAI